MKGLRVNRVSKAEMDNGRADGRVSGLIVAGWMEVMAFDVDVSPIVCVMICLSLASQASIISDATVFAGILRLCCAEISATRSMMC